jgi:L-fuculose-phosphate aldolase
VLVGSHLPAVFDKVAYLEYICDVHLRAAATGLAPRLLSEHEVELAVAGLTGYGQQGSGEAG